MTVMMATSLSVSSAKADMIPTRTIIDAWSSPQGDSTATKQGIHLLLAREDVRAQMVALGVDPDEAASRVDALTDRELSLLAGHLDDLPAGEGAMTTVALVALIVTLVVTLASRLSSGSRRPCSYPYNRC